MSLLARNARDTSAVFALTLDEGGAARTIRYAEQLERTRRTAAALLSLGVRPGDRVHLQMPNRPEFFDIWFAAGWLGAALVPTSPQSTADELRHVLTDASPRVSLVQGGAGTAAVTGVVTLPLAGPDSFASLLAQSDAGAAPEAPAGKATDLGAVLYTSGTTSRPKGVMVTHANYVEVGAAVAHHLRVSAADRWLVALPLFHANAQYYCTMSALVAGASLVLPPRFSASAWQTQAARHDVTLGSLFAAPIRMILAQPPGEQRPTRLRGVLFAQNLTDSQAQEFEQRMGTRLLQLYGMTETVLPPTINPDSDQRRWASIGLPLHRVDVRLTDDRGQVVTRGGTGEIQVRGEPGRTVAAGYLNDLRATAATFGADGWLRTGDLARVGDDGFLYFVDRAKDMIKRSGENVAASEVERVIGEHPAVLECAVVGVADPVRDEAIVAHVVLRAGAAIEERDLLAWCQQRLASFKVPGTFIVVDELPRTSVGKVHKNALRRSAAGVAGGLQQAAATA